jgi:hypothetical protein
MVLGEVKDFSPRDGDLYTLADVMEEKYTETGREYIESMDYFSSISGCSINELTYEKLMWHAKLLLETPIYRGGGNSKDGKRGGTKKLPQPMTVLRKFAYLSSAINHMIKKGINLENHCLKVVSYIRNIEEKRKKNE